MRDSDFKHLTIGVLALQGAFREHTTALQRCGATALPVRRRRELAGLDALVIPGGESTAIGKLLVSYHLLEPVRQMGAAGVPLLGTCAGLVMLARGVVGGDQPLLGLMDIMVRRNAFGRQVKSFEAPLSVPALGTVAGAANRASVAPFPGVFIRAPWIESAGAGVEVLAEHDGHAVAARQGNMIVTAFHPELTDDLRLHQLWLELVAETVSR
ncbi:MAG: pyridoxal 5'-phosphate synthase glutaminase subunit PdxT [Thermoleophilia bacterium]